VDKPKLDLSKVRHGPMSSKEQFLRKWTPSDDYREGYDRIFGKKNTKEEDDGERVRPILVSEVDEG